MIWFRSALAALGLLAMTIGFSGTAWAQGANQAADPPIAYVVKPGDNLFTLGHAYLLHWHDYVLVQKANHIADPLRLPIRSTILFDPALLKSQPTDARISAVSGQVSITVGARTSRAEVGMAVAEGQTIATGAGAFVTLELADESRVTLPSLSTVRVVRLRSFALTDAVQRVFALDTGRADIAAAHNGNPNSRFEVHTPLSVSAVRGTEFRVDQDSTGARSATGVVDGGVAVLPANGTGSEILVPKNFGVSVTHAGVGGLVALLPAPQLTRGGRDQEDRDVAFAIQPTPGAKAYRLQLANDAGFIDIFAESTSPDLTATFHGVPDGTYFVRATALDAGGIEGLPTAYSFERSLNTIDPGAPPKAETVGKMHRYLFRWSASGEGERTYHFQLYPAADLKTPLVDLPGLADPQVTIIDLPPNAYIWRVTAVRFKDGKFTEKAGAPQALRIGE